MAPFQLGLSIFFGKKAQQMVQVIAELLPEIMCINGP
jgi:hypothetical protein